MTRSMLWVAVFGALACAAACTGIIDDPGSGAPGGGTGSRGPTGTGTGTGIGECAGESALPSRVWRLSHAQYDNTVHDLLGDTTAPARSFEPEASGTGFENGAHVGFVSETLAEQYMRTAESLAATAVANLDALLPCAPADPGDRACVGDFVASFGRRAFRRPLDAEQTAMYMALYDEGAAVSPELGVEIVISAMLQSPHFLYRFELGDPAADGSEAALSGYEIATQLSYLLWNTTPDDALLDAAEAGRLDDDAGLAAEIDRMLADARSEHVVWDFFEQYFRFGQVLTVDKDSRVFPELTQEIASLLLDEAHTFVREVAWNGEGTLIDLLTADYAYVNDTLAGFYGFSGATGGAMQRVAVDPDRRAGLLTHGAWLATFGGQQSGSPTFRGLFVRAQLLCQDVPEPPANVADSLEPPSEVHTTRDRYMAHMGREPCTGCHKFIDPIGFGFEAFDGIGRFRTEENGFPIDATGEIVGTAEIDGPFDGARQLAERLAGSREVSDCVATHFYRYAFGRLEGERDACTLESVRARFAESGTTVRDLVRAVIESRAFRYRAPGG